MPAILPSSGFALYVRATPATWPRLQPFARSGDLFWGHLAGVPRDVAAFTFGSYPVLETRGGDDVLKNYAAANLDGEYKNFDVALDEATKIRQYVNSYNQRNATTANFIPLKFTAFYHLNIIDAHPDIVKQPDVVIVGKTNWTAANVQQEAEKYIKLITQAGRIPGILLGNQTSIRGTRTKVSNTSSDTLAEFESVIAPAPKGLDLKVVSFFYPKDDSTNLVDTLKILRSR